MRARALGVSVVAFASVLTGCCGTGNGGTLQLDQQVMVAFVHHDQPDATFVTQSDDYRAWQVGSRAPTPGAIEGVSLASDLDGVGRMLAWRQGDAIQLRYGIGESAWESEPGPLGLSVDAADVPSVAPLAWGPSDSRWMVAFRSPAAVTSLRVYDAGTRLFHEREFGPAQVMGTASARRVLVARSYRKGTAAQPERDLTLLVWQDTFQPGVGAKTHCAVGDHVYVHVNDGTNVSWNHRLVRASGIDLQSTLPDDVAVAADAEFFYVGALQYLDGNMSSVSIVRSADGVVWTAFGSAEFPTTSRPQRPAIAPVRRTVSGQERTSVLVLVAPAAPPASEEAVIALVELGGRSTLLDPAGSGPFAGDWPGFQRAYSLATVGVIEVNP